MGGELGCCFLFYSLRFSISEILSFHKSIWKKSLERGKGFPPRPRSPPWMPRGVSLGNHPLLTFDLTLITFARLPNSRGGSEDIHQARISIFCSRAIFYIMFQIKLWLKVLGKLFARFKHCWFTSTGQFCQAMSGSLFWRTSEISLNIFMISKKWLQIALQSGQLRKMN